MEEYARVADSKKKADSEESAFVLVTPRSLRERGAPGWIIDLLR